jgi:amino acid permease
MRDLMKQRKQYLIDKKFQLKHAFTIIGISFVVIGVIIATITFNAANNNNEINTNNSKLKSIVENHSNIITIQDNIVNALLTYSQSPNNRIQKNAIRDVYANHSRNMKSLNNNIFVIKDIISKNRSIIQHNNTLLVILCILVILQGLILYFLLIRKTHRISGPIFVMTNYMKDIIRGEYPESFRKIRKNDELKDFYELFVVMIQTLKNKK